MDSNLPIKEETTLEDDRATGGHVGDLLGSRSRKAIGGEKTKADKTKSDRRTTLAGRGGKSTIRRSSMGMNVETVQEARNEEGIPEFDITIASIFREAQELQMQERIDHVQEKAEKEASHSSHSTARERIAERRQTGPGMTSARHPPEPKAKTHAPVQAVRRNVGELRDTDLRGYASLQELLTSTEEWSVDDEKPKNEDPSPRPFTTPGRPRPKKLPKLTVTDRWNIEGKRQFPKAGGRLEQHRNSTFNQRPHYVRSFARSSMSLATSRADSSSSSSSEESSALTGSTGASDDLLKEIADTNVSQDWNLLLAFARDGSNGPDNPLLSAGDDLAKWASKKESSMVPRREVTIVTRPVAFIQGQSVIQEERQEQVASPLRPGVYVGHDDQNTMISDLAKRVRLPPGLPDDAHAATHLEAHKGKAGEDGPLSARRKRVFEISNAQSKLAKAMGLIMEEQEDDRRTEESRNYQAWRKKVIECARSMRLEVDRFQLEPRGA